MQWAHCAAHRIFRRHSLSQCVEERGNCTLGVPNSGSLVPASFQGPWATETGRQPGNQGGAEHGAVKGCQPETPSRCAYVDDHGQKERSRVGRRLKTADSSAGSIHSVGE